MTSKYKTQVYEPAEILNERPRPRVIVTGFSKQVNESIVEIVQEVVPTADIVERLDSINLSEYDLAITGSTYTLLDSLNLGSHLDENHMWKQLFPKHMSIIYLPLNNGHNDAYLDFRPPAGDGPELPDKALVLSESKPGKHVRYVSGLRPDIQDLVKRCAAPAALDRESHRTLYVGGSSTTTNDLDFQLRPFLLGPDDECLAGSYKRSDEAAGWILPADLIGGDLKSWILCALREWHELYPKRFPPVPDWEMDARWQTTKELEVAARLGLENEEFLALTHAHDERRRKLEEELVEARKNANVCERALLSASGPELEVAVGGSLTNLGFIVKAMDSEYPSDASREDFQVRDPDDSAWLALAEVKGFTKGVSEIGLQSLGRWVELYAVENQLIPGARWYIANFKRREHPDIRGVALGGRDDVLSVFAASGGLLVDTRALFRLTQFCEDNPTACPQARLFLRVTTGRVGLADAEEWIADYQERFNPAQD